MILKNSVIGFLQEFVLLGSKYLYLFLFGVLSFLRKEKSIFIEGEKSKKHEGWIKKNILYSNLAFCRRKFSPMFEMTVPFLLYIFSPFLFWKILFKRKLNVNLPVVTVILFFFISVSTTSFAQQEVQIETSLESPYHTIFTHLYFLQNDSYNAEKSALAIYGNYSEKQKQEYAIKIKKVLDGKGLYIDMGLLPHNTNYVDSSVNKSVYFLSSSEKLIYLEKIDNSWYYSNTTVQNINELYKEVYPFWLVYIDKILSDKLSNSSFIGIRTWQYVALIILAVISLLLYYIVRGISSLVLKKTAIPYLKKHDTSEDVLLKLSKAFSLIITFAFVGKVIPSLQMPLKLSIGLILVNKILLILFAAFFVVNLFKIIIYFAEKAADKTETKLDNQLLPILTKIAILIIYFIAGVFALQELGVNVNALLAGLSIGGLAVALASKDTLQNVIGSLNIFLDRPFEIGDYILIDGVEGEVEEVGLRATRIRTINQSLAYIPNGVLSNMTIDNYGLRVYRRWRTSFGLDYSTDPALIELFTVEARKIINEKEFTLADKTMVYFNNMGASTLDIYISVFLDVATFSEDLNCKQIILLEMLQMAKDNKVEFAFPTQTIYRK